MRNPGKVLVNQGLTGARGRQKPYRNQAVTGTRGPGKFVKTFLLITPKKFQTAPK